MNAYVYRAALLCERCGESKRKSLARVAPCDPDNESSYDSDHFPKGPYPQGGGEADSPQHCEHCGKFLANPLTSDGYDYVREGCAVARATGRVNAIVLTVWAPYYNIDTEKE